jgi:hypothetical protein
VFGPGSKIGTLLRWAPLAFLIGGGALWALSPLGVRLSEAKFKTPDVFWKLFVSAPLTLGLGLVGLSLLGGERRGLAAKIGLWAALAGAALVVAGDAGLFHLGVDDYYIMAAPAYRAFRAGLVLLAAGALLFGAAETRNRGLPVWAGLPFALSALSGLAAAVQDLGPFGAALWAVFGAGWIWLGFAFLVDSFQGTGRGEAISGRRSGHGLTMPKGTSTVTDGR